jgi:hypothetical protein
MGRCLAGLEKSVKRERRGEVRNPKAEDLALNNT